MTYYNNYSTYNFTGFTEETLLAAGSDNGSKLGCGDTFTMPGSAEIEFTVRDDDPFLSGDCYDRATDYRGQTAEITDCEGNSLGNGGQIYAESYFWVSDQHGNWYVMIEIEQEGAGDDYFTFFTGGGYSVPPAGAELTVGKSCDVRGDWLKYDHLGGGDKAPATGSIEGRVFCDLDCDGVDGGVTIIEGRDYVIEAEDMYSKGFRTVSGHQASGGELVKLKDGKGELKTTFNGIDGVYDFTLRVQDESDGHSRIKILVNGKEVGTVKLDGDGDGAGDDNGGFSAFRIEGVELKAGDKITIKADGDGCEFVRIDNLVLEGRDQEVVTQEPPKEGVTVCLLDANGDPVLDKDGQPITTVTDADGQYRFDNVPAGDYRVKFVNPDGTEFTLQDVGGDDAIDSDADASGVTGVVSVVAGETTSDVDAGLKEVPIVEEPLCIDENTTFVTDLDLVVKCPRPGDDGLDACMVREENKFDKPVALTFNLGDALTDVIISSQAAKKVDAALTGATDNDSTVFIRVSREEDPDEADANDIFFAGDVDLGGSFTALRDNAGRDFGGQTYIHIFDQENGQLLQTIEFHTSCSQPIVIGDQFGSVTLSGFGFKGPNGSLIEYGGTTVDMLLEGDIVYSIAGGADAALFQVDPDTGEVSFINAPDFENPLDDGGDNFYDVVIRATAKDDPTCFTDAPLQVEVKDVREASSISGTYFCDDDRDGVDDGAPVDPDIAGKTVMLLAADGVTQATDLDGNPVPAQFTDANGNYSFTNLAAGTYVVMFENSLAEGKAFIAPDQGGDDTIDSDVDANGKVTVTVGENEDVTDVDAGVANRASSISGTYFCDDDRDGVDDGAPVDPDIAGKSVMLFLADGVTPATDIDGNPLPTTVTDANGNYTFANLAAGTYVVMFAPTEGKAFIAPDQGGDDTVDSDVDANGKVTVTVGAGEDVMDVDAGVATLPASISGRYFCDVGPEDDVEDPDDLPVPGKMVMLFLADGVTPATDIDGNPVPTQITDDNGEYSFTNLAPGGYVVKFENSASDGKDFSDQDVGQDGDMDVATDSDVIEDGIAFNDGVTDVVTVGAGENRTDVDAGVVDVLGSISGRYFCDENRNNVDDGEPGLAGVTVVLTDDAGNFIADTLTGADGSYLFDGLQAGAYKVTFPAPVADPVGPTPVDPVNVQSDDFSSGVIEPFWTFVPSPKVPGSTAEVMVDGGDAVLCLSVQPGDSDPNPADGMNDAARLLQQIADADFQVETAFQSIPQQRFEVQGIMVEEDANDWMRFDLRANAANEWFLFVGYSDEGAPTTVLNVKIADPTDAAAMRITRTGDDWTFETSSDGVTWFPRAAFTHAGISPNAVGPFVGALPPENDGYTAKVDYFFNSQSPIPFEDRSLEAASEVKTFIQKDFGLDDTIDSDVDPATGMTDTIFLRSAEDRTDVDAGVAGPPKGAIGDTVFIDSFGNGLLDAFEARLGGVTVQLKDSGGTVIAETVTSLDGTYLFQNLEAGTYTVQVILPDGFEFTAQNAGDDTLDSDVDQLTGMTGTITLAEGETNLTVDAGLLACGLIEGTSQSDPNSPDGGFDLLVGCSSDDTILGFSGGDTLIGNGGDDQLFGMFGNDVLKGGAGNDLIDGGKGITGGGVAIDTAVYDGVQADYEIIRTGVGAFTVRDLNLADGDEGFDTLVDIEQIQFADGIFV